MLKILLWVYIVGCVCGLISMTLITLKCMSKGSRMKKDGGYEKPTVDVFNKIYGVIESIILILMPIFHYAIFFSVIFIDEEKLNEMIEEKIR